MRYSTSGAARDSEHCRQRFEGEGAAMRRDTFLSHPEVHGLPDVAECLGDAGAGGAQGGEYRAGQPDQKGNP